MPSLRSSSVVLLSGGLDSLAAFHWAHLETDIILGLTLNYGQRAAQREIAVAQEICKKYDIKHQVVDLNWFSQLKASPLLSEGVPLPQLSVADLNNQSVVEKSAAAVWVPNRNGVFVNVAASVAENWVANWIVVGFNKEEAATFPDNSEAFVTAINESLKYSTKGKVSVKAPMGGKTKKEIVRWLLDHDGDLTHLWSCYRGEEKMCGACESCLRCKRALTEAGADKWVRKLF